MMILIIILHVIACIGLIGVVLIQRGRGSGLVESFQGVESMFGTKTNVFLTRTTTVLSVLFFFTCLGLAVLSVRQSRSLMRNVKAQAPQDKQAASGAKDEKQPAAQPQAEEKAAALPPGPEKEEPKQEAPASAGQAKAEQK